MRSTTNEKMIYSLRSTIQHFWILSSGNFTLLWKIPCIMYFPINKCVCFSIVMLDYQRVYQHQSSFTTMNHFFTMIPHLP